MEDIADDIPSFGIALARIGDNGCKRRIIDKIVTVESGCGDMACCCVESSCCWTGLHRVPRCSSVFIMLWKVLYRLEVAFPSDMNENAEHSSHDDINIDIQTIRCIILTG